MMTVMTMLMEMMMMMMIRIEMEEGSWHQHQRQPGGSRPDALSSLIIGHPLLDHDDNDDDDDYHDDFDDLLQWGRQWDWAMLNERASIPTISQYFTFLTSAWGTLVPHWGWFDIHWYLSGQWWCYLNRLLLWLWWWWQRYYLTGPL